MSGDCDIAGSPSFQSSSPARRTALETRSTVPANDAQLLQLVRTRLGRAVKDRIDVSSCGLVVKLHGRVEERNERHRLEAAVRGVSGVRDVVNKIGVRRTGW